MADIFISYASEDRSRVEPLAKALEDREWSVFWDRIIPIGKNWDDVIEEEIDAAKCIIVIWSDISVASGWVRAEAEEGLRRNILIPVQIDNAKIPLRFRSIQTADLAEWNQNTDHSGFTILLDAISGIVGPSPLKVKEEEEKRAKAARKAEEARQKKEAETKRKTEEDQERRTVKEESKPRKPEPDAIKPSEPRKKSNAFKFGVVAGVVVLFVAGIWWYVSDSKKMRPRTQEQSLAEPETVETKRQPVITNSIGMRFSQIPAGSFTMGRQVLEEGQNSDEIQNHVSITRPFYLQTTEVTQGQWKKVMGKNPSRFRDCGKNCPVEQVSWNDIQDFIAKLNAKEGVIYYRLPSEAEWEYACRAGSTTIYSFGDDEEQLEKYAWFDRNSNGKTHPVGTRKPNEWGLYDMYGNVWEWVEDDWHDNYEGAPNDGTPWIDNPRGTYRMLRGGGWSSGYYVAVSDSRSTRILPDEGTHHRGFRLARSVTLDP